MNRRPLPLAAALPLSLMAASLGGCVAAALVPLAAGGTLTGREIAGKGSSTTRPDDRTATPVVIVGKDATSAVPGTIRPEPTPEPENPEFQKPVIQPEKLPDTPMAGISVANASPQPPQAGPGTPEPDDGYAAMTRYVLAAAESARPGSTRTSALLDQQTLATVPARAPCGDRRSALLIDLDPGADPFDLDDPPTPAPGLAAHLRTIRGTGTAVVWIATLPRSAEKRLGTILRATGLDPLGIDPVLLLRERETRKQQILLRADEEWCVLAIAGDRKADFDEVFDYLRNPDGPVAVALEQNIGAGWFLVPSPIR